MEKRVSDIFRLMRPFNKNERRTIRELSKFLDKKEMGDVKYLLKLRKVYIEIKQITIVNFSYPVIKALDKESKEAKKIAEYYNNKINETISRELFSEFSKKSEKIKEYIAPNIEGFGDIKEASMLLLFSEKMHILLLGDPGTGKTEILRYVDKLAPISSFGLGSGTSGVGLSINVQGKEVTKGLLPLANNGVCCIDELNLMKKQDMASLYNAMEKGFVTYDKGKTHIRMDAKIKVLATANPRGDKFEGKKKEKIREQLPFDPALLTRFHIVFFIRKPDIEKFMKITRKIVRDEKINIKEEDIHFIKKYIEYAKSIDVGLEPEFEAKIIEFVEEIKKDENSFIVDITPRIVKGIINIAKANARLHLRNKTSREDIEKAINILKHSLYNVY
ncbi:ATP-binding protein [Candidatus Woesearchaeota archaeon]|nr:ATP-binding protein [Candidatus Woesearchaeota archaeon]